MARNLQSETMRRHRQASERERSALWRALDHAAVAARDALVQPGDANTELAGAFERIVGAARSIVDQGSHRPLEFACKAPSVHVVETLRKFFIRELAAADEAVASKDIIAVLDALEYIQSEVQARVSSRREPEFSGTLHGDALDLVVDIAHDLRSPLTAILFLTDSLRRKQSGPLTPGQERQLALVYSATFGLSGLANDLIAMARGRRLLDLQQVPFSISEILQSVCDIVRPVAEEKGLRVYVAPMEPRTCIGYPLALSRVLLNLTSNAVHVSTAGHVCLSCTELSTDRVHFSVCDTGPGISDEQRATLFEPFRPRDRHEHRGFSSAGLGLAICRKLVAAMGGTLAVESALGQGTRFYFELGLPLVPML